MEELLIDYHKPIRIRRRKDLLCEGVDVYDLNINYCGTEIHIVGTGRVGDDVVFNYCLSDEPIASTISKHFLDRFAENI